ncbi:DciA family protein [Gloeobacter kilaueensis]|uniref:DUF721 domain-containing protein n=1 Tax=Gloeobacter kilaueensis (strain ATCC BAA-2537 / CCAP 1431/1 / ULC 316 / JS1) TaxID=1183438 RepID=U5QFI6_GLOK1|nr:DUF721 domain-containing protein [Gloeobacter kilaueensis]AGY57732.1 hypothetical protein GKIL_1486 [Gloeobacter kilaueensis JS1]
MKPASLASLLAELTRSPQMARNARLVQLQKQWPDIAGAAVSAHSRPLRLQEGTLTVAVSSAVWAQNLGYQRRLLINRIAAVWGSAEAIHDIRFETTGWYARTRSTALPLLPEHPLIVPLAGQPPVLRDPSTTLSERLERLQQLAQWRIGQLPACPRCRLGAPPRELERWGMCGSCIVRS